MDKSVEIVNQWALKIQGVIEQYGPKAADMALSLGRIDAMQPLLFGTFLLLLGVVPLYLWFSRLWTWVYKNFDESDGLSVMAGVLGTVAMCGPAFAGMCRLLNIYYWVGLFHPEVYLAAKALGWT